MDRNTILLTGGAGYIGSHTYVALAQVGISAVILDDFSNSSPMVLDRLQRITGHSVAFERGSISNTTLVEDILKRHSIAAVVHFAGFKAVGESVNRPLDYYRNNLCGTISLLEAMEAAGCRTLAFSSSATVYGNPQTVPITEDFPLSHTNPYGHTKLACEDILNAMRVANPAWRIGILRYFNPIGAHSSGLIGESPLGVPNNLLPYISQVAVGNRPYLNVYGNDYPTADGTGVRDYIHVMDLAEGHVAAVQSLLERSSSFTVNLGTGRGYSVLEVLHAFEQASGKSVPYQIAPRRPGDIATCFADASLAARLLNWRAKRTLVDACLDTWHWQQSNPNGYDTVVTS